MQFDFDTPVKRAGLGNMKYLTTPAEVSHAGIVSYNGAEMEFATAPSVIASMKQCVENGLYGYTLSDQTYRDAVGWWMETQRGYRIENDWIVTTHGTIFSVATAIRMATNPGEGVIVQPPVYNRYEQAAVRLGRRAVYNRLVEEDGAYHIDLDDLEARMADKNNKLMVLCNPHNPIGKVWPKAALEAVAALARRYGVIVFSDEIFAEVVFGGYTCIPYATVAGAEKHAIVSTSLGKTFNFTGVNHANMIIPDRDLRERFTAQRNADHYGSLDPLAYAAILGAYCPEGAAWKDAMTAYVWNNYKALQAFFSRYLPAVRLYPLEGCFVVWIDWTGLGMHAAELGQFLVSEALLDLDAGPHYGGGGCFTRMSIAVPGKTLEKTLDLLLAALKRRGILNQSA